MRKLYVPIGMDPAHSADVYDADFKQLGVDTVFFTEPERIVLESQDRYDLIMKRISECVETYEGLGYECGMWISTLGYGGPLNAFGKENNFTQIRSIVGATAGDASCPTDEKFVSRVCDTIKDIARAGAKIIMLDDELCLSVRPGLGCACDNHLSEFSRRMGKSITLEELPKLLFTGETNEYRKEWLKMQGDTMRAFCRTLRSALDEVAPDTRLGFCSGYTSWDVEGTDAIELTKILAGGTKPFLRFTSAPYWLHKQRFGASPLPTFIELARMQTAWTKDEGIEVFTECDTFPHDRFHTPVSHVQCFDAATMLTKDVGALKYFYHYPCFPETERGYIDAHLAAKEDFEKLQAAFHSRNEVGIRVYEEMHKLADAALPEKFNASTSQKQIMTKHIFSEAQKMLSVNAIPTVYEGKGLCGIVFGENAKYLTDEAINSGLILDIDAAEILQSKGIDVGLLDTKPLELNVLEDFGDGLPVSVYWATDLCDVKINENAKVISEFVDTDYFTEPRYRTPSAYLYENKNGQRFLVYAFRAKNQPEISGVYWSYGRGKQITNAIEWLGGKPLPVVCCGHPYGYCRCNEDDSSVAVAYFNCSPDGVDALDLTFSRPVKNVRLIGGAGDLIDPLTVRIKDVSSFGYVAAVAEYI